MRLEADVKSEYSKTILFRFKEITYPLLVKEEFTKIDINKIIKIILRKIF